LVILKPLVIHLRSFDIPLIKYCRPFDNPHSLSCFVILLFIFIVVTSDFHFHPVNIPSLPSSYSLPSSISYHRTFFNHLPPYGSLFVFAQLTNSQFFFNLSVLPYRTSNTAFVYRRLFRSRYHLLSLLHNTLPVHFCLIN
jgi:hypothetical protein